MHTIDQINAMSDAEVRAANNQLSKILAKRIAVRVVVFAAVAVATQLIINKLDSDKSA